MVEGRLVPDIQPHLPQAIKWIHFFFGGTILQEVEPIEDTRIHRALIIANNQQINPLVNQGSVEKVKIYQEDIYTVEVSK